MASNSILFNRTTKIGMMTMTKVACVTYIGDSNVTLYVITDGQKGRHIPMLIGQVTHRRRRCERGTRKSKATPEADFLLD
jgi:hypothetical protein